MRINTDGKYAWRTDLYDRVGEQLGENTRSGAIDASCKFTHEMLANLEAATDHSDMTEDLARTLSTSSVEIEYRIESGVRIKD
ncbi:DUF7692 domain-containing protein [Halalkalicoccus tibetensis]|uniref:DUF7692 domain-containing protein n=1 Tax=Halalkalicoccus tibetensis TaxID=175632 RepID=A0ABD5V6P4_9EURY